METNVVALLTVLAATIGVLLALYIVLLLVDSYRTVSEALVPLFLSPGVLGEPEELVSIETSDGVRLNGWWVQGEGKTVIVCLHGFLANRCEWVPYGPRLRARGASLYFVDHRCHGGSARSKCTFGIDEVKDVRAAVQFARQKQPGCKVVLLGSSMGGTAAARAVASDPSLADAVILDGPYANLREAALGFWYVTGFKSIATLMKPTALFGRLWLGFSLGSVDMETSYSGLQGTPTLFLYGETDTVVPKTSAERSVRAARGEAVWFPGCGHAQGRFSEPARYYNAIESFLDRLGLLDRPIVEVPDEKTPTFSRSGAV